MARLHIEIMNSHSLISRCCFWLVIIHAIAKTSDENVLQSINVRDIEPEIVREENEILR